MWDKLSFEQNGTSFEHLQALLAIIELIMYDENDLGFLLS